MNNYKIAIIHDWLVTNAGAEKVLKEIISLYPESDVYSLVDFLSKENKKEILNNKKVKTSFIQKLPFAKKYFRNYLPLFPRGIESFNLGSYDMIISSSWAVAKGIKKRKDQLHICYCHTPVRYAWDLYDEYTSSLNIFKKILVKMSLKYLRKWDLNSLDRVDYFIANSNFVQERIQRIYNRTATVIYPPIDMKKFGLYEEKENFYLTVSRLVPYKKTKLIVEAFVKMPDKNLVVIGEGTEYEAIKKIATSNIRVLGYQNDAILVSAMQRAKAFIYVAVEDFGIVPIEAMSCGTPVIALNDGGTAETIIHKVTGIHFEKQNTKSIIKSIEVFEKMTFNSSEIREHSKKFDNFKSQLKCFVDEKRREFQ